MDRNVNRQTERWIEMQVDRQKNGQKCKQIDLKRDRNKNRQTEREIEMQIDRQI